jgi:hypothetical protein
MTQSPIGLHRSSASPGPAEARDRPPAEDQLLHVVIGGRLKGIGSHEFDDLSEVELVGVYPNYAEAYRAWRSKAQFTVDNALVRYFIIHAHRLLDPSQDATPH